MKKNIVKSITASTIITISLMLFNRLYAAITGKVIGLTMVGGDCKECIGFGWSELTLYPEMTAEEAATWQPESILQFDMISFLFTLLIVFIIATIIYTIKSRKDAI